MPNRLLAPRYPARSSLLRHYRMRAVWPLGEPSGMGLDLVGGNHLADNNTVTTMTGILGPARAFAAASSEHLGILDNAALSLGAGVRMTMGGWFYATAATVGLWGKWDGASNEYLAYFQSDGTIRFYVTGIVAGTINVGSRTPSLSAWHFAACRYDGINISVKVDGQAWENLALTTDIIDGTAPFDIGRQAGVQYLNGGVQHLFFCKSALPDGVVDAIYNGGKGLAFPWVGVL